MANKFRGDMSITLGGVEYAMRPTFEALVEFEDKAGMTAYEAMKALEQRTAAPARVVAAAFWAGIRGASTRPERCPTFLQIGAAVQATGLAKLLPDYIKFLGSALASDDELRESAEAERSAAEQAKAGAPGEA